MAPFALAIAAPLTTTPPAAASLTPPPTNYTSGNACLVYVVPANINQVDIEAIGAAGFPGEGSGSPGGKGGDVSGQFNVETGQKLYVVVGTDGGGSGKENIGSSGGADFGGGGGNSDKEYGLDNGTSYGGGGGGASFVSTDGAQCNGTGASVNMSDVLLVAGGGGGGGSADALGNDGGAGGNAGQAGGDSEQDCIFVCTGGGNAGGAGTSTGGGAGGNSFGGGGGSLSDAPASTSSGYVYTDGGSANASSGFGGAGGGGWFGGGQGGDNGETYGGGGGGSNYTAPGAANVTTGVAASTGTTPEITISPVDSRRLQVSKFGAGSGTVTSGDNPQTINCGSTCTAYYAPGTSVTLTASAAAGSRFAGWNGGGCSGTGTTCTVSLGDAQNVSATFNVIWQVQVNKQQTGGTGNGTITSSPAGFPCGTGCTAFDSGTHVTLTATPDSSSIFQGWSTGGVFPSCDGSTGPCSFTPTDRNLTIYANFSGNVLTLTKDGSGNGTITSTDTPQTVNCADGCTGTSHLYGWGQQVTLTATPDPGSSFQWETYPCVATSLTCTLTMEGNQTIDGRFFKTPEALTVSTLGSGPGNVVSSPAGINCQGTCGFGPGTNSRSANFDQNSQVTLTATPQTGTPGSDSSFSGWGGACASFGTVPTCTVTMTGAESASASFSLLSRYDLTVSPAGNATGTVTSSDTPQSIDCSGGIVCGATYDQGTSVTLTATPDAHAVFAGWSGGCTNTTGPCTVTMNQAEEVTPTFNLVKETLTVTMSGTGLGTVISGDTPQSIDCGVGVTAPTCSADYNYGQVVVLQATVDPSHPTSFDGWGSTPCTNSQSPPSTLCDVAVTGPTTADAAFTREVETISVSETGTGTGSVTSDLTGTDGNAINCPTACSKSFDLNSQVTLTATPTGDSVFTGWAPGSCLGSFVSAGSGTCFLILNQQGQTAAVTALFAPNDLTVTTLGTGNGTVASGDNPQTIDCGSACVGAYPPGTAVTLTATPQAGSSFSEWGGACAAAGTSSTCTITMSGASSATATFAPTIPNPQLTVVLTGPGSSADFVGSADGSISCGESGLATACSVSDPSGTNFQLTAEGNSANATSFSQWTSGPCAGSSNPTCSFALNATVTATAAFTQATNPLTVATTGTGGGSVSSPETPPAIDCPNACSAVYPDVSAPVQLTESPDANSVFNGWSGACSGTSTVCNVSMTQAQSVSADFEPIPTHTLTIAPIGNGRGTVTTTDGNIDCAYNPRTTSAPSACSFSYPSGTFVGLNATTDNSSFNNSFFNNGFGCIPSYFPQNIPGAACTIQVNSSITADPQFVLNTTPVVVTMLDQQGMTAPAGTITSTPAGIDCLPDENLPPPYNHYAPGQGPCGANFETGSTVTLLAVPQSTAAFTSDPFSGDGCTDTQAEQNAGICTVVVDPSNNYWNVNFTPGPVNFNLGFGGTGSGSVSFSHPSVSCSANCTVQEPYNTNPSGGFVTLTETPGPNSTFAGWSGPGVTGTFCPSRTGSSCTYQVGTGTLNASATFNTIPQTLTVDLGGSPLGDGTVTSQPAGVDCASLVTSECQQQFPNGTIVNLTATPNSATSSFTGWSGACTDTTPVCTVTLSSDTEVQANFVLNTQTLTVDTAGSGTGNVTSTSPAGLVSCGSSGSMCSVGVYNGTSVTLTAAPDNGYVFGGWSGACTNSTGDCTVSMGSDETVTATFEPPPLGLDVNTGGDGTGAVTSSPVGIDCPGACNGEFEPGTQVTLTAVPDTTTSTFNGWTGDCNGILLTCSVTVDQAKAVTATFSLIPRELDVATNGGSGTGSVSSNPAGISCGAICSADFLNGTLVDLTPTADSASEFDGWTGACTNVTGDCLVTMDQAQSVTAIFNVIPERMLTVEDDGTGSGTVSSNPSGIDCGSTCSANFQSDSQVVLTAAPDTTTSTFTGWSGDCSGDSLTCTVTLDQARSVTAEFDLLPESLAVTNAGTGSGTVTSDPSGVSCPGTCSANFPYGTSVTLTASADPGSSSFTGWSGGLCSGTGSCTVTMTQARSVTATFTLLQRSLTVSKAGPGSGTVTGGSNTINCGTTCSASYPNGTGVTLTATPASTSTFVGWSGACSGSNTSCQVTMTAALSATATFAAKTTTTLSSNVASPVFGQPVTFTATVASLGTGPPTGTVTFSVDGVPHGPVNLVAGKASFGPTSTLVVGSNTVSASYAPADATYVSSASSPLSVKVSQAASKVTLTQSPNPVANGGSVVITAMVTVVAPGGGTPTGTIQFRLGKSNVGSPVRLTNGLATLPVSKVTRNQTYTATYSGDGNFAASTATISLVTSKK